MSKKRITATLIGSPEPIKGRARQRPPEWLRRIMLARLAEQSRRLQSINYDLSGESDGAAMARSIIKHETRRAVVNALPYLETSQFPEVKQEMLSLMVDDPKPPRQSRRAQWDKALVSSVDPFE